MAENCLSFLLISSSYRNTYKMVSKDDLNTEQQSKWLTREDKRKVSMKFGTLFAALSASTWFTSSHLNTLSPANTGLQQYLIRDVEFPIKNKHMELVQGFGSLLGRSPTLGGGDRTGTYTWVGGVELADTMDKFVIIKGKRVLDLGTGKYKFQLYTIVCSFYM